MGLNPALEEIASLYEAYLDEFRRLEQTRKPLEGCFGFGGGPQSYPCHEAFARDLERLLEHLTAQAPASEQAGQMLNYLYFTAPARWQSETAPYWMMLAVQGFTTGLIQCLDAPTAEALYEEYRHFYPRCQRLPVQNKILDALRMKQKRRAL